MNKNYRLQGDTHTLKKDYTKIKIVNVRTLLIQTSALCTKPIISIISNQLKWILVYHKFTT